MKYIWLSAALLLLPSLPAAAKERAATQVVVKPVLSTALTATGQAITLPQKDVHVVVTTYDIASGARLPEHKHPYARYAYVLAGTLRVTNTDTGRSEIYRPGAFIVEAIDQWHKAANIGQGSVRLLVIDQIEGDRNNTVLR
jgi:quercetin dioxygenase-like cupin family protein